MTISQPPETPPSKLFGWWAAVTILLSAFLLFQVQPLISKAILPWFGGTPAVWTTCMLFFQVVLVAGYAYAHWITQIKSRQLQLAIHAGLLLLAATRFPITPSDFWKPPDGASPTFRILALLAVNVGLPYFMLATTGPLVQRWFGWVYAGRSPYRLYALSNVGSLAALLTYPIGIEPFLAVPQQGLIWSSLFVLFALLCGGMALWLRSKPEDLEPVKTELPASEFATTPPKPQAKGKPKIPPKPHVEPVDASRLLTRLLWILLPAWASMTFLAVTNHLCQDVAVVPFLWVLPLSVYLLSFIICFDGERWYKPWFFAAGTVVFVLFLTLLTRIDFFDNLVTVINEARRGQSRIEWKPSQVLTDVVAIPGPLGIQSFLHWSVIVYSVCGMTAVVLLIRRQLASEHFARNTRARNRIDAVVVLCSILAFAAGVVVCLNLLLGSFGRPYSAAGFEDDIVGQSYLFLSTLFFICMLCHGELVRLKPPPEELTGYYLRISLGGAIGGLFVGLICPQIFTSYSELAISLTGGLALALLVLWNRAQQGWLAGRFIISVGLLLAGMMFVIAVALVHLPAPPADQIAGARNFYGAIHVRHLNADDKKWENYGLYNGRILHGQQYIHPDRRDEPTTYYAPDSGVGLAAERLPRQDGQEFRVGVIGLGAGTMAAHGQKGDYYHFYEIDPKVVRLSDKYFTYRSRSAARCDVALGDARIQMEKELREGGAMKFNLLVLDAFSSDAIPVHLITVEAMELYQKHLQPDGIIAFHVSNRFLNLNPIVYGLAKKFGYQTVEVNSPEGKGPGAAESTWILLTNNQDFLNDGEVELRSRPRSLAKGEPEEILWTDKFSNLWKVLKK